MRFKIKNKSKLLESIISESENTLEPEKLERYFELLLKQLRENPERLIIEKKIKEYLFLEENYRKFWHP